MRVMVRSCGAVDFHFMLGEYEGLHVKEFLTREQHKFLMEYVRYLFGRHICNLVKGLKSNRLQAM